MMCDLCVDLYVTFTLPVEELGERGSGVGDKGEKEVSVCFPCILL